MDDIRDITINDDECLISHDVVSLLTNTPIEPTLDIIRKKLENNKTIHKRTKLSVDDLMTLTKFVLTTTYFTCMGNIYQQQQGVAMGSPLSPIAVDLFMEWLEERAIATAPPNCRPRLWKRYVDDLLEIIKKGEAENLTAHLQAYLRGGIRWQHSLPRHTHDKKRRWHYKTLYLQDINSHQPVPPVQFTPLAPSKTRRGLYIIGQEG